MTILFHIIWAVFVAAIFFSAIGFISRIVRTVLAMLHERKAKNRLKR